MNKQPISYLQTDKRWRDLPYETAGEQATIGSAGCGPTCAAMLIETLTGKPFTPEDACAWALAHGYKLRDRGTSYAYFMPQFAAFDLNCEMVGWVNTYGKPDHINHKKVEDKLREGYYAIALMGKGLWAAQGHFVVLWWQDDKVHINDPAGNRSPRIKGDPKKFRAQVKYYWLVDARAYNKAQPQKQEEAALTEQDIRTIVREELARLEEERAKLPPSDWAKAKLAIAHAKGITDGSRPQSYATRQEVILMVNAVK